jgi:hypothetical protein
MPLTIKQRQRLERLVRRLDNKDNVISLDRVKHGTLLERAKVKLGDTFMNTVILLVFVIFIATVVWSVLVKKP